MENMYDEEMADIIKNIPLKYTSRILILVLSFLTVILCLSIIIKKPDVIKSKVRIISSPAPITLRAKTDGYLNILVNNLDTVSKNDKLAYINGDFSIHEILRLEKLLKEERLSDTVFTTNTFGYLGKIESYYIDFFNNLKTYSDFLRFNTHQIELHLLKSAEIKMIKEQTLQKDADIFLEKIKNLYQEQYNIDYKLFNDKVLTYENFWRSKLNYTKENYNSLSHKIVECNLASEILIMQQKQKLLIKNYKKEVADLELSVKTSKDLLLSKIEEFKKMNIIIAPINGIAEILTLTRDRNYIFHTQKILSIIPNNNDIFAQAIIPANRYGKVKDGQSVDIKLNDYPYYEYGSLKGTLKSISNISEDTTYFAKIALNNGLITTNNKKLRFIHNMSGTADIITKEKSILANIFDKLYILFH